MGMVRGSCVLEREGKRRDVYIDIYTHISLCIYTCTYKLSLALHI